MIKAVLFDYGGVLTAAGKGGSIGRVVTELFGIDIGWEHIDHLHNSLRLGDITSEEFFVRLSALHRSPRVVTEDDWHELSRDVFERSEPVYSLAQRLRQQGIQTGIVSNIYQMTADVLRQLGNYDGFYPVLLSCELHAIKPEPTIYKMAIQNLDVEPQEIIFVDDLEKCLPPAQSLGMRTVLATDPEQIVREVTAIVEKENKIVV